MNLITSGLFHEAIASQSHRKVFHEGIAYRKSQFATRAARNLFHKALAAQIADRKSQPVSQSSL